jgi:molybdate transport system ATP-binding protein
MISIAIKKELQGSKGSMDLAVDLEINDGAFVALSGPSGSGKTTLLRILAGLETATGHISVGDQTWLDNDQTVSPSQREIGFVFQDYALFSNMSVEQNLLFVCKDKSLANELLEMTGLSALRSRMPHSLSGGQQQRLALCRAMMRRPKLLLMDEPLSALDPQMRLKLQDEILALHKAFGTTTLMVSHDPSEIYRLADRVIALDYGSIVGDGTPKDVLLKTRGSQKFSFEGELLDIIKVDVIHIAIVSIGQQLVEVVVSRKEVENLRIGSRVSVGTKAFAPTIMSCH